MIPFYEEHGIPLQRVLTRPRNRILRDARPPRIRALPAVEDIDHTRTKAKSPQTNGIVERFHKTMLDEFYRVAFRKKIYAAVDDLQADLRRLDARVQRGNTSPGENGASERPRSTPSLTPCPSHAKKLNRSTRQTNPQPHDLQRPACAVRQIK